MHDRDWESLSLSTFSTINTSHTVSVERLKVLCDELDAPKGFLYLVGYHLLGHSKSNLNTTSKEKAPILDDIINFMAKLFVHCTCQADLIIVALDDMQHTDEMSWKVIEKLYETGENILFLCGSRPFGVRSKVGGEFWSKLSHTQEEDERFQQLALGSLEQNDIAKMISMHLSCTVNDLDPQFVKDIFNHTRGMPHFAYQALENCKRKNLHGRLSDNSVGWSKNVTEV